eukprot:362265-Chlamydomonas_euryale.AAC.7
MLKVLRKIEGTFKCLAGSLEGACYMLWTRMYWPKPDLSHVLRCRQEVERSVEVCERLVDALGPDADTMCGHEAVELDDLLAGCCCCKVNHHVRQLREPQPLGSAWPAGPPAWHSAGSVLRPAALLRCCLAHRLTDNSTAKPVAGSQ